MNQLVDDVSSWKVQIAAADRVPAREDRPTPVPATEHADQPSFMPEGVRGDRHGEPRVSITPMAVDVQTEITIERPRAEVAGYTADVDNATRWYENIRIVDWKTEPPLAVGSRVAFVATFLGRELAYTYEVKALVPGEQLVMSTADGPFPMETTYTWEDTPEGGTRMSIRNRGEPAGFSRIAAPLMERAMRRANRKDLRRLKTILESSHGS